MWQVLKLYYSFKTKIFCHNIWLVPKVVVHKCVLLYQLIFWMLHHSIKWKFRKCIPIIGIDSNYLENFKIQRIQVSQLQLWSQFCNFFKIFIPVTKLKNLVTLATVLVTIWFLSISTVNIANMFVKGVKYGWYHLVTQGIS